MRFKNFQISDIPIPHGIRLRKYRKYFRHGLIEERAIRDIIDVEIFVEIDSKSELFLRTQGLLLKSQKNSSNPFIRKWSCY